MTLIAVLIGGAIGAALAWTIHNWAWAKHLDFDGRERR